MPPKNKTEKQSNKADISQDDLQELYDTLSKQNKLISQQTKDNDFKPTIIPLQANRSPIMQTALAGTMSYDNSAPMWVAPSYSQIKDLSIQKDTEGKIQKSNWDKTREKFYDAIPDVGDPTYARARMLMNEAIDKHDKALKDGLWSDNASLVSNFAKDLYEKKGGKQLMARQQAQEEQRKTVEDQIANYDAKEGVKGIRPDKINYYLTGKNDPYKFDNEGNVIGGGNLVYPDIYEERNLIKEEDDLVKGIIADSRENLDKDGNKVYTIPTGLTGKYAIPGIENVTEDRIHELVKAHLLNTGGNEYLQREGEIKQFNSPLDVDSAKNLLAQYSKEVEDKDNIFTKLLALPDSELQTQLNNGLGAKLQEQELKHSLFSGMTAKYAYEKQTLKEIEEIAEIEAVKAQYKKASEEKEMPNEAISTSIMTFQTIDTVQELDPTSPLAIEKKKTSLLEQLDGNVNKNIKGLKSTLQEIMKQPNYQNLPDYKKTIGAIKRVDNTLKTLTDQSNTTAKWYGDRMKEETKVGLYSLYDDYAGQAEFKNGKEPLSRTDFINTMAAAIAAESDNDSNTKAIDILKRNGIDSLISYVGNKNFKKIQNSNLQSYPNVVTNSKTSKQITIGSTGPGSVTYQTTDYNNGNLLEVITRTANNVKRKLKDSKTNPLYVNSKVSYLDDIDGATAAKSPAGTAFNTLNNTTSSFIANNLEGAVIYDPLREKPVTVASFFKERYGLNPEMVAQVFDLDKFKLHVTTSQNYMNTVDASMIFAGTFLLKDGVTKENNSKAFEVQQKLRKDLGANRAVNLRLTLGDNQKSKEAEYTNVLKDLYNERRFTASSEENKRKLALLYGNAIGISSATDDLNIYNLSGNVKDKNNYRDITLSGNQLRIVARNSPFAKSKLDKDFMVKQKFGNEFKTFAVDDKTGQLGYYTDTQLENNKDLTIYTFDTDMDLKAYFSGGLLDSQINFNKGGGGNSAGFVKPEPIDYNKLKNHNLINNEAKVQAIINKFSNNSPFSAKDFIEVSKSTGVPIELLLAQGIQESNLGTKGMAVRTKNIGNVGNNGNTGKTTHHNNWIDGLYRQANLLKTDYIANSYEDIDRLLNTNFLRPKKGGRYAEENNYAHAISKRLNEISESL